MPVAVDLNPVFPVDEPTGGSVAGDDIASQRRAQFARFEQSESTGNMLDLSAATRSPSAPREMLDSVVLQTPVGEIEFGPPSGVSLTMRIALMTGESNPNRVMNAMYRTLMCVRKIDGAAVTPITNDVEAQYLANKLTDPVLDYLFEVLRENWPAPDSKDLQVLRKNKRIA